MKIINTVLFTSIFSFNINAAFTEPDMSQLAEINRKKGMPDTYQTLQ
ncbi:hypothetical protein [Pantoea sp. BAV 3049]|nr:hypothetical protein [Pantoea sp. BAV 3049]